MASSHHSGQTVSADAEILLILLLPRRRLAQRLYMYKASTTRICLGLNCALRCMLSKKSTGLA
jgi:hypothetical protein